MIFRNSNQRKHYEKPIKKRKYTNVYQAGYHLDPVKNLYYTEITEYEPIDITEDEYQELLKYAPIENEKCSVTIEHTPDTTWSNAIKVIANVFSLFVISLTICEISSLELG